MMPCKTCGAWGTPPAFLSEVPTDPYTGVPLLIARRDDGIVLYSVGKDGIDDGGATELQGGQPADIGFRLFDLDKRNLPPDDDD